MSQPIILIGAGGHAKVLADALDSQGQTITAYVDPNPSAWLDALNIPRISESDLQAQLPAVTLVIGFVGLSIEALIRRAAIMRDYIAQGANIPPVIHASAIIGQHVRVGAGVQILAGSIINAYATLEDGVVINTGAVIEHDAHISACTHVAPRAVVLGSAHIGEACFVGANSVVIQGANLKPHSFIKALSIHQ